MRFGYGDAMLCRLLMLGRASRLLHDLSDTLSNRDRCGRDAVVLARESVEYECRRGRGGDGSEYRSALEAALRRVGWFFVMLKSGNSGQCSSRSEERSGRC